MAQGGQGGLAGGSPVGAFGSPHRAGSGGSGRRP